MTAHPRRLQATGHGHFLTIRPPPRTCTPVAVLVLYELAVTLEMVIDQMNNPSKSTQVSCRGAAEGPVDEELRPRYGRWLRRHLG